MFDPASIAIIQLRVFVDFIVQTPPVTSSKRARALPSSVIDHELQESTPPRLDVVCCNGMNGVLGTPMLAFASPLLAYVGPILPIAKCLVVLPDSYP